MAWNEDDLHRALLRGERPRGLVGSRGHDAAVLAELAGRPVVCTDQCIEGVHFDVRTGARLAGRKAAARALSDLAATAALPRAVLLALCAPLEREERWLREAILGVREMAREHGADLVGGDLACAPGPASLAVTALGGIAAGVRPPGRDRARPGQAVLVTGPCGGSSLGRHLRIEPRIELGRWLHARGATALMDVSDGLAWDLYRLARASGVRIELDMDLLRIHRDAERLARRTGRPAWDHALHDGEDHELIACLPRSRIERVNREGRARGLPVPWGEIGRVVRGRGLALGYRAHEVEWTPDMGGWKHGA